MAENFREPFVNPYVDDESDEARFSTFVTMDEAHERWNNGTWRGSKTALAASRTVQRTFFGIRKYTRTVPSTNKIKFMVL